MYCLWTACHSPRTVLHPRCPQLLVQPRSRHAHSNQKTQSSRKTARVCMRSPLPKKPWLRSCEQFDFYSSFTTRYPASPNASVSLMFTFSISSWLPATFTQMGDPVLLHGHRATLLWHPTKSQLWCPLPQLPFPSMSRRMAELYGGKRHSSTLQHKKIITTFTKVWWQCW